MKKLASQSEKSLSDLEGSTKTIVEIQQSKRLQKLITPLEKGEGSNQAHGKEDGNASTKAREVKETPMELGFDSEETIGPRFGPWMVVSKSRKGKNREAAKGKGKGMAGGTLSPFKGQEKFHESGSRFSSLQDDDGTNSHFVEKTSIKPLKAKDGVSFFAEKVMGLRFLLAQVLL